MMASSTTMPSVRMNANIEIMFSVTSISGRIANEPMNTTGMETATQKARRGLRNTPSSMITSSRPMRAVLQQDLAAFGIALGAVVVNADRDRVGQLGVEVLDQRAHPRRQFDRSLVLGLIDIQAQPGAAVEFEYLRTLREAVDQLGDIAKQDA